jgi:hypothetical protein
MICFKCNTDNKLKERQQNSGRCKSCQHEFVFDPKQMSGVSFTDKFFQNTLQKLSVNNSLFFTSRQLYYFFNQQLNKQKMDLLRAAGCFGLLGAVVFCILMIAAGLPWLGVLALLLALPLSIAIIWSENFRRKLRGIPLAVPPNQVDAWFQRWCRINGDVKKLLGPIGAGSNEKAKDISAELKQYSFDRAVICQSSTIARCLIANNFHFENNSAVLSIEKYPPDIFETVMEMLRRNPELQVYALHDASRPGVTLSHMLRTDANWFAGTTARIFDLGLLPRQVMNRKVCVEKETPGLNQLVPQEVLASLLPEEINWLEAGNFVSLESFPPQVLLRIVTRGIAKSRQPEAVDALVPVIWADGDPGIYFYGTESFG